MRLPSSFSTITWVSLVTRKRRCMKPGRGFRYVQVLNPHSWEISLRCEFLQLPQNNARICMDDDTVIILLVLLLWRVGSGLCRCEACLSSLITRFEICTDQRDKFETIIGNRVTARNWNKDGFEQLLVSTQCPQLQRSDRDLMIHL